MTRWDPAKHPVMGDTFRCADAAPTCPKCGMVANGAKPTTGRANPPRDGDLSLCAQCGAVSEFCDGALRAVDESLFDDDARADLRQARAHLANLLAKN